MALCRARALNTCWVLSRASALPRLGRPTLSRDYHPKGCLCSRLTMRRVHASCDHVAAVLLVSRVPLATAHAVLPNGGWFAGIRGRLDVGLSLFSSGFLAAATDLLSAYSSGLKNVPCITAATSALATPVRVNSKLCRHDLRFGRSRRHLAL